jgi:hypothetical protein
MNWFTSRSPKVKAVSGVAAMVAVAVLWMLVSALFLKPRAALREQIATVRANIIDLQEQVELQDELVSEGQALAARTLAAEPDVAVARLRDGLSRVGETAGMVNIAVTHGRPIGVTNPLTQARGVNSKLKSALRKEKDFEVLRASLVGRGSLDQVLTCLSLAQSQAWIHRVEGFELKPAAGGKSEGRYDLRVDVVTLLAPAMLARGKDGKRVEPEVTLATARSGLEATWRAIVEKNPFRRPPDQATESAIASSNPVEVVPPSASTQTPPDVQAFAPYEDWRLTGVVVGSRGPEAFFMNVRTQERVTLLKGAKLLDVSFVDGSGERAIVELGGERFGLLNGQALSARHPLDKVD